MDIFDLSAKLTLDSSGYEEGIGKSQSAAKNFASFLGSGFATAAKAGAAAIGAAASGVAFLLKESVQQFADYEQLVGGVETLFKNSAGVVQQYAADAYKTAGLSANQYMETVTSFSASLLQSLGGDTEKAAQYANTAIIDMSDNANKMGTDMTMIQNAYQGFAKQNYTMLDNLKLGYGGTKTEMERLILDAEKLDSSFVATRDANGDLAMSYADIVDAIHIVQTEMGITGTTAKEASETISGSLYSLKAAWSNLVVGFATDGADLDGLITNVVDSAETAFNNLAPAFEKALTGISTGVEKIAPIIAGKLPGIINKLLPSITSTAAKAVQSFVKGISQNARSLTKSALQVVKTLSNAIIANLPEIVRAGLEIITELAKGIAEALPDLVPTIVDVILEIVDVLTDPANLSALVDGAIAIVTGLADGLIQALPQLLDRLPEIVDNIVTVIVENGPKMLDAGLQLISSLAEYLVSEEGAAKLAESAGKIVDSVVDGIIVLASRLFDAGLQLLDDLANSLTDGEKLKEIASKADEIVSTLFDTIVGLGLKLFEAGGKLLDKLAEGLANAAGLGDLYRKGKEAVGEFLKGVFGSEDAVKEAGKAIMEYFIASLAFPGGGALVATKRVGQSIVDALTDGVDEGQGQAEQSGEGLANAATSSMDGSAEAQAAGENTARGFAVGIGSSVAQTAVLTAAKNLAQSAVNAMKSTLQIKSPSKLTRKFGKFFSDGFSLGILDELDSVEDAADDAALTAADALSGYGNDGYLTDTYVERTEDGSGVQSAALESIAALLEEIRDKIGGDVVLDSGELVGYIDGALGTLSTRKARAGAW